MSQDPFSLDELRAANKIELPAAENLVANDGVTLSYRRYLPQSPRAVVLFYHGGGAHNAASYPHLGQGLKTQGIATYMPDLRGHGASGGTRGDAPSPKQVWADVSSFIQHIRAELPNLPLFLGGHSSGSGLVLNYASQPNHLPVEHYLFLSPQFGFRSNTARVPVLASFAKVNKLPFILNAMSGKMLAGHSHAVQFNYPAELLATNPSLLTSYSVNMANAVTPAAPHQQFAQLDRPFGLWIGSDDEQIDADKVLAFADLASKVRAQSHIQRINGAKHLSILLNSHDMIGAWIQRSVSSPA